MPEQGLCWDLILLPCSLVKIYCSLSIYLYWIDLSQSQRANESFPPQYPQHNAQLLEVGQLLDSSLRTTNWILKASIGEICIPPGTYKNIEPQEDFELSSEHLADRSRLSPPMIRYLLDVYDHYIRPVYLLPHPEPQRYQEEVRLAQVDVLQHFYILISCAISARLLGLREPTWIAVAHTFRWMVKWFGSYCLYAQQRFLGLCVTTVHLRDDRS